jgi:hypothetical protein
MLKFNTEDHRIRNDGKINYELKIEINVERSDQALFQDTIPEIFVKMIKRSQDLQSNQGPPGQEYYSLCQSKLGTRRYWARKGIHIGSWWEKLYVTDHFEDLGVDGSIILKWIYSNNTLFPQNEGNFLTR